MGHALCSVLVARQQGQINPLLQNWCRDGSWRAAGRPLSLWRDGLKMGMWLGALQIPVLKQKSLNESAKPSLFSFSALVTGMPFPQGNAFSVSSL